MPVLSATDAGQAILVVGTEASSGRMQVSLRHRIEYAVLWVAAFAGHVMSYRLALGVGAGIAAFMFHILRWRRTEAEARIAQVFGTDLTPGEIRTIAWKSIRNLLFQVVELLLATRLNPEWMAKHADSEAFRKTMEAQLSKGQGAVLAVIHMGNWDAAGIGMEQQGVPLLVIAKKQKNPLVNNYLNSARSVRDSVVVDSDDPNLMKKVLEWLNAGKVVAILVDLRAGEQSAPLSFLGHQVPIGRGVGAIARKANVPIYPTITRREGWSQHIWQVRDPILPDTNLNARADSIRMTQECLTLFDGVIRTYPAEYFWYNKKWLIKETPT